MDTSRRFRDSPLFTVLERVIPRALRVSMRPLLAPWLLSPPVGWVRWGSLRRTAPISSVFGYDRGRPVDRYYIEKFLEDHRGDIHGHVLEVSDSGYTMQFGGAQVTQSDVLHSVKGSPGATIVDDLTCPAHLAPDTFDCILLTHTLQFIYDVHAAVRTLFAILKPGGVVLAASPGISQISRYDMDRWGEYWRFTSLSATRLFEQAFPSSSVTVRACGNVLSSIALLHGICAEELRKEELDQGDPDYQLIICVRAAKPDSV